VDADLDTLATALDVRVDDLLKILPERAPWRPAVGIAPKMPVADIVCAVDFATDRAARAGIRVGPVVILGHSSGAHLAALAALATAHFRGACPYAPARIDG
jgi:alpha-beta hydrolase superfamily lysophospholipase